MPNAPEPDRDGADRRNVPASERTTDPGVHPPESSSPIPHDAETETVVISTPDPESPPEAAKPARERRFTAPGFDAKETQVIATAPEAATEVLHTHPAPSVPPPPPPTIPLKTAVPQSIPPRPGAAKAAMSGHRNWGWVLAVVVIVLALAAIAIFGTLLLTRDKRSKVSQEDLVRHAIQSFDVAIQTGDLTALRGITCGTTRDGYVEYDERSWAETYRRVSAAKQYPVIASIDEVVVNGQQAEANVTTFMAYDPQVRSTRSIDLQFRDDQWKICQSPSG
ncbi:hypothetical protein H7H78_12955 [Mycobacterium shinjukuense]|uniref:Membrane protein n=1 Tax=Mycobacterium shinjukuense TaxID=398694 RepID=A0A7I7MUL3_9MYCO|nr:hypothetical protein [Mycobacterium shinjukuense]MCV6986309.1 hypothetical protein [Mycobacterium shinjukuense]ORB62644.1 hypothetical protein BST45_18650 [Mycobacterium shinjukuense]BBX75193.1 membrane protein [Mycobacterium shinjukuense]